MIDYSTAPAVPGRQCGNCTLCCKVLEITELDKPRGEWCPRCSAGRGCLAYDARPDECRGFYCGFLKIPSLNELWRPSIAKLIVCVEPGNKAVFVQVDPDRPHAWKKEPYYAKLKEWARNAAPSRGQVVVKIGKRVIVILPDRDVDVGPVGDDEMVVTKELKGPMGVTRDAFKIRRDDPRMAGITLQAPKGVIPLS